MYFIAVDKWITNATTETQHNRPSDKVRKKNQKLCGNYQAHYAEEYVDYAENTLDYAEI